MTTYAIDQYYNRHDPAKHFEKHLVRAGYGVQSAEINEIQDNLLGRTKDIADVLFKDGDIVRDCQCTVNDITGAVTLNSGAIYLQGAVRGMAPGAFTIPVNTIIAIGVRLVTSVITELQDPTLRDPATGTRNYDEAGAGRLKVEPLWGWDGDGGPGDFYPVYTVENGILLSKDAPPALDSITSAIARYDRDSAGGNYIISGLSVSSAYDRVNQKLVVTIGEGRARVNGYPIEVARGIRLSYDADPDIKTVISEPKTFSPGGGGTMRVDVDNAPLVQIVQVRATMQKAVTVTRGAVSGGRDPLPDNSVLQLVSVTQGATTYVIGTDVKLTSGEVDWSLTGAEPAPGSSYSVTYQYQTATGATITAQDDTGFTIAGPVAGSLFTIDYTFAQPRIDAIVLDADGRVSRIKGVATQYNPSAPTIPDTQLRIAGLAHGWAGDPTVQSDAVVVLPMQELQGLRSLIFDLFDLVAQERLRTSVSLTDPTAKRGVFVDPFNNDNLRDSGITQQLAIIDGELILAVAPTVNQIGTPTAAELLPYTVETIIEQPYRTTTMKVNPYQAFDPLPIAMKLDPAVDFWTDVVTTWGSDITRRFVSGAAAGSVVTTSNGVQVTTTTTQAQFLRQRYVGFTLTGMGSGEVLQTLTFDGVTVTPELP